MQFSSRIVTEKNIVAVMGAFRTTLVVTRLPPTHLRFERAFQHCRQPMFLQDCNNVCMRQQDQAFIVNALNVNHTYHLEKASQTLHRTHFWTKKICTT